MNIDIRPVSEDLENHIIAVKDRFDIKTNSKVIEFCTVNYLSKVDEIKSLKDQIHRIKTELSLEKIKILNFKSSLDALLK